MPRTTDDDHPLERLGRALELAAARQAAATGDHPRSAAGRRPWRALASRRAVALAVLVAGSGVGAAAWAATTLFSSGAPVPFQRGAPIAGRAQGAAIPGSVRMLADDVADPAGGPPWGLRYWETDRKFACVQVGRVVDGKLGQVTRGQVFHELRLGVAENALGGCYALDGSGHGFVAVHADAQAGGIPAPCPTGFQTGTQLSGRRGARITCTEPDRTVDFGLLGPNATRLRYRSGGRSLTAAPLGGVGAYLVVQRHLRPVIREFGFHHRDPRMNVHGPAEATLALTPASQVIRRVTYRDGTCTVRITGNVRGSCSAQAGYVRIPQPTIRDVRARVRAYPAPGGRGIRVRFRARAAVVDARTGYDVEVRPVGGRFGFTTQTYSRNVRAGALVRMTVGRYAGRRGPYRIVVRFRSASPFPGPVAPPQYPGLLVGVARVTVP